MSILANTQLLNSNWPKTLPKNSFLSQVLNIAEEKLSDLESLARSKCNFELDKETKLLSKILTSDADQNRRR